jgi:gluconokinase
MLAIVRLPHSSSGKKDTRPHEAALELRRELKEAEVHARTGARFHASYWPAKLRWLTIHSPAAFSQMDQWLSFGEYVHRRGAPIRYVG